jgi:uncharacterized protein
MATQAPSNQGTDHGSDYTNAAPDSGRSGNWMQLADGSKFWPTDPRPEDIDILNIAHALAHQCRYAGHCTDFYSVAEHSYHVSYLVPEEHALTGLLHDGTEAYLVDIPRPLKPYLLGYAEMEARLWDCIAERYRLPPAIPGVVKDIDSAIILAEREQIITPTDHDWGLDAFTKPHVTIRCWTPQEAKRRFLSRFAELCTDFGEDLDKVSVSQ